MGACLEACLGGGQLSLVDQVMPAWRCIAAGLCGLVHSQEVPLAVGVDARPGHVICPRRNRCPALPPEVHLGRDQVQPCRTPPCSQGSRSLEPARIAYCSGQIRSLNIVSCVPGRAS